MTAKLHDAASSGGIASGLRTRSTARVDRRSDADRRAVVCGNGRQARDRRYGRGAAVGPDRSSTWPTVIARKGDLFIGSPLSVAHWRCGASLDGGWDLRAGRTTYNDAIAMAPNIDPITHASVVTWTLHSRDPSRGAPPDDTTVRDTPDGAADRRASGDDSMRHSNSPWVARSCIGTRPPTVARTGAADAGPRHVPAASVLPDASTRYRVVYGA